MLDNCFVSIIDLSSPGLKEQKLRQNNNFFVFSCLTNILRNSLLNPQYKQARSYVRPLVGVKNDLNNPNDLQCCLKRVERGKKIESKYI